MEAHGTKFIKGAVPTKLEKTEDDRIKVSYDQDGSEIFDTVLFAIGRHANTSALNLDAVGIKCEQNGKIKVDDFQQTNIDNIYAIGDVIHGALELTPVAIKAGALLSERLFAGSKKKMDTINVPTTVFTPIEYGSCGYSEQAAKEKFGAENIDTYHTAF